MSKKVLVRAINKRQFELDLEPPYNFKPKVKDILEEHDFCKGVKILNQRKGRDTLILASPKGVYGVDPQELLEDLEDNEVDIMEYPCDVLIAMNIIDKELLLGVIVKGINWLSVEYENNTSFRFDSLLSKQRSDSKNRIELGTSMDARDIIKEGLLNLYVSKVNALKQQLSKSYLFIYLGVGIWYESFTIKKCTDNTHVKVKFILDDSGEETYEVTLDVYKTGEYKFKRKDS